MMVGHASLGVLLGIRHIVSPERLLGMLLVLILLLLLMLLRVVIAGVLLLLLLHVMGVRLLLPGVGSLTRMRVHLLRRLRLARVRSIMRMLALLGHSAVLVGHSPVGIHSLRMVLHVLWGVAPVRMALLLRVWLVMVLGHMSLAIVASLIVVEVAASSPWTVEIVRVRTLGRPPAPSLTIGTSSSHVHVHIHIHVHAPHGGHAPDAQIERAAMRMNHPARHAGALIRMVGMRMTGVSPPSRISIAVVRPARGVEISSGILVVVLVVDGIGIHGVMDPSGGTGSSSSAGASVRRAIPMTISNLVVAGDGPAAAASPPAPRWQGEVVVVSVVEVAAVGIGIGMRTIVHCRWGWHDLDVLLSCMLVDGNIQTE
mmetsp:Transcript_3812/g.8195  ORF Transcript_3812/g.8195 Transcript_3812/m.8195 type:complete len:370 (-) Transcript_3812:402-1511(-)